MEIKTTRKNISKKLNIPKGSNVLVSVSGGRSSAYLAYFLKAHFDDYWNLFYVFANTGQEKEETLIFVDKLDKTLNLNLFWLEAMVNKRKGIATKHKIVSFKTADRKGKCFENVIKKYGIPNLGYPHCTRELKLAPIHTFAKSKYDTYFTAIGIRADEYKRAIVKKGFFYPLADILITDKKMVLDFWKKQSYDLDLEEHEGNCIWCWKKSFNKHVKLYNENKEYFNFPKKMEKKYSNSIEGRDKQFFFRKHESTKELLKRIKNVS